MNEEKIIGMGGAFVHDGVLYESGLIYLKSQNRWTHITKELAEQKTIKSVLESKASLAAEEKKEVLSTDKPKRGRKPKNESTN